MCLRAKRGELEMTTRWTIVFGIGMVVMVGLLIAAVVLKKLSLVAIAVVGVPLVTSVGIILVVFIEVLIEHWK